MMLQKHLAPTREQSDESNTDEESDDEIFNSDDEVDDEVDDDKRKTLQKIKIGENVILSY